ncbi:hypothetical protein IscW_ISCW023101 [Ixodes scapularis]|uniref:Uncharacterized protein n=1 Tax=Ixodes scapularis TaxID=6945 RepID=B7QMJ9_IXOSC|nr:hypothetical protein IscW_ISCW023101 [Ixodes scapularis]|eukprot:XP_002416404.1 hypothetical protein IscW_ISCW023101 [Ixodes scapularis]
MSAQLEHEMAAFNVQHQDAMEGARRLWDEEKRALRVAQAEELQCCFEQLRASLTKLVCSPPERNAVPEQMHLPPSEAPPPDRCRRRLPFSRSRRPEIAKESCAHAVVENPTCSRGFLTGSAGIDRR